MLDNLQKRIFTALLIYPSIVLIILYSNDVIIRLFLNIIIFLASFEISKMCFYNIQLEKGKRKHYYFIASIFISIFIANILIKNNAWLFLIITSSILWVLIPIHLYNIKKINKIDEFNIFYFLIFLLLISSLYCSLYITYIYSQKALIFLISIVALADISAFFIGKRFGKRKFFSIISPNKTTEGFIGSIFIYNQNFIYNIFCCTHICIW